MSIITEALKKLERNRTLSSKEYLNKILGPERNSSFKKDAFKTEKPSAETDISSEDSEVPNVIYRLRSKTLVISGILLLLTIVFLTATNIFLIPSLNVEIARSERPADFEKIPVAEAYTNVNPELALVENKTNLINRMTRVLRGSSIQDEFMSNFKLSGIIHDADDSWAIVNDKIVRAGDYLDGATVVSVVPHKIVLLYKNERFDLVVE